MPAIGIDQANLEHSDRASTVGRVAASMAHEFNNILMVIQPFAEVLSRQDSSEVAQRATRNILQAVQRGRSVTQSVLSFTHPTELVKVKIDVKPWLRSRESALTAALGSRVRLHLSIDEIDEDALIVLGDRHQLDQVLTNLAVNARDAVQDSGELSILVERCQRGSAFPFDAIRTDHPHLHMRVADTGSGMDAETLANMFDPFFTTKRSRTGLGLAVVQQILQLHAGCIVAESAVEKGTVLHLFLPIAEKQPGVPVSPQRHREEFLPPL